MTTFNSIYVILVVLTKKQRINERFIPLSMSVHYANQIIRLVRGKHAYINA